jgi:hypothetical protein
MLKTVEANVLYALVVVIGLVVFYGGAIVIYKYSKKHPPKNTFMQVIDRLATNAVYELETTDADNQTKMHSVISQVIDNLKILGIAIPDNIEVIIQSAAEHAVADMKNDKAIAHNVATPVIKQVVSSPVAESNSNSNTDATTYMAPTAETEELPVVEEDIKDLAVEANATDDSIGVKDSDTANNNKQVE